MSNERFEKWFDKWFLRLMGAIVIVMLASVVFVILNTRSWNEALETAPCDRFATYSVKNVPARCLAYFSTIDGGH